MQKVDYNLKMKEIIKAQQEKPRLLLHSCCAPCSSSVLQKIKEFFDVTVVYYNPNIYPKEEYLKRKQEQIRLLETLGINFMDCDYDEDEAMGEAVADSGEFYLGASLDNLTHVYCGIILERKEYEL